MSEAGGHDRAIWSGYRLGRRTLLRVLGKASGLALLALAGVFIAGYFIVPPDIASTRVDISVVNSTSGFYAMMPRWAVLQRGIQVQVPAGEYACPDLASASQEFSQRCALNTAYTGTVEEFVPIARPNVAWIYQMQLNAAGWDRPHYFVRLQHGGEQRFVGIAVVHPAPSVDDDNAVSAGTNIHIGTATLTVDDDTHVRLRRLSESEADVFITDGPLAGKDAVVHVSDLDYDVSVFSFVDFH